ncbi:MAG: phosphatidylserine decarboxylase [Elusimicrobia bacterium]|nr:phosphatidylserine decarboxylase [Elusimicrobiota bacterium]
MRLRSRLPIVSMGIYWILILWALGATAWVALPFGWSGLLVAAIVLFSCFVAFFFRDPERAEPQDTKQVWSPADGRILEIERDSNGGANIRIFLSLFDVHIQRSPISGVVCELKNLPGSFKPAMRKGAAVNFRKAIAIQGEVGGHAFLLRVEQIAGILARRIACWVVAGKRLRAGERLGMIYFGSQVALYLPLEFQILVEKGDRVFAGVTPVARWK